MYHLYVLGALPLVWVMALMRISPAKREKLCGAKKVFFLIGAVLLALCLALGQLGNYVKLVCDQLDGTQAAYAAQFKNEYALCDAAGEEDVALLPAWTVQTMTGKPTAFEDETMWTNESMAAYFGVKAVKAVEPSEPSELAIQ